MVTVQVMNASHKCTGPWHLHFDDEPWCSSSYPSYTVLLRGIYSVPTIMMVVKCELIRPGVPLKLNILPDQFVVTINVPQGIGSPDRILPSMNCSHPSNCCTFRVHSTQRRPHSVLLYFQPSRP